MASGKRAPRVLVVDDHFDTARSYYVGLRMDGYEAEFAVNGYGAIEAARRFRPDIVILDLKLPDMDGCEIARVLRREPSCKDARIVAVTGASGEEQRQRALEAGCAECLAKPLDPLVLESILLGQR